MADFKIIIGIWLVAQGLVVPLCFNLDEKLKDFVLIDLELLVLLVVVYIGLKLIGV